MDWLSTDVALPRVAILCSENQQLPSACQHGGQPPLNVPRLALSVDVGGVFGDSRTCLTIGLSASRRLLPPSGAPRGHIWQCVPRSKVQGVCVCVCVCVCGRMVQWFVQSISSRNIVGSIPAEYGFTRLSSPSLSLGGYQQPNVYV